MLAFKNLSRIEIAWRGIASEITTVLQGVEGGESATGVAKGCDSIGQEGFLAGTDGMDVQIKESGNCKAALCFNDCCSSR